MSVVIHFLHFDACVASLCIFVLLVLLQSQKPVVLMTIDDVSSWLNEIKLGQFSAAFRSNEVDGKVLVELTKDGLAEMGLGPVHQSRFQAAMKVLSGQFRASLRVHLRWLCCAGSSGVHGGSGLDREVDLKALGIDPGSSRVPIGQGAFGQVFKPFCFPLSDFFVFFSGFSLPVPLDRRCGQNGDGHGLSSRSGTAR